MSIFSAKTKHIAIETKHIVLSHETKGVVTQVPSTKYKLAKLGQAQGGVPVFQTIWEYIRVARILIHSQVVDSFQKKQNGHYSNVATLGMV